jgi:hypothetical protein
MERKTDIFNAVDAEGNKYRIKEYTDYLSNASGKDIKGLRRYITTDDIMVNRISENEFDVHDSFHMKYIRVTRES